MFDWSKMPPVSLPFELPSPFAMPGAKKDGQESGLPFPFSLLENMPQFPFSIPGAQESGEESETFGALPLSFLFPFYQMSLMYRFLQTFVPRQEEQEEPAEQEGFSPFGFPVPPIVLQKLLQLDASPKTLEQMQRAMDFFFDAAGSDE